MLVQGLAKAILGVKGDYDPEDDLVLQVQARPNDIEGFNLQVRACAWLCMQSVQWSVSGSEAGSAGPIGCQPGVPGGDSRAHAGKPEARKGERACCKQMAGALPCIHSI